MITLTRSRFELVNKVLDEYEKNKDYVDMRVINAVAGTAFTIGIQGHAGTKTLYLVCDFPSDYKICGLREYGTAKIKLPRRIWMVPVLSSMNFTHPLYMKMYLVNRKNQVVQSPFPNQDSVGRTCWYHPFTASKNPADIFNELATIDSHFWASDANDHWNEYAKIEVLKWLVDKSGTEDWSKAVISNHAIWKKQGAALKKIASRRRSLNTLPLASKDFQIFVPRDVYSLDLVRTRLEELVNIL